MIIIFLKIIKFKVLDFNSFYFSTDYVNYWIFHELLKTIDFGINPGQKLIVFKQRLYTDIFNFYKRLREYECFHLNVMLIVPQPSNTV